MRKICDACFRLQTLRNPWIQRKCDEGVQRKEVLAVPGGFEDLKNVNSAGGWDNACHYRSAYSAVLLGLLEKRCYWIG
jgi:hypothetical protein